MLNISAVVGDAFGGDAREIKVYGELISDHFVGHCPRDISQLPTLRHNDVSLVKFEPVQPQCRTLVISSDFYLCYLTSSKRNLIRVVHKSTGALLMARGHESPVSDMQFSAQDGHIFLSSDIQGKSILWKLNDNNEPEKLQEYAFPASIVRSYPTDPMSWLLANVDKTAISSLTQYNQYEKSHTFSFQTENISDFCASSSGGRVFFVSKRNELSSVCVAPQLGLTLSETNPAMTLMNDRPIQALLSLKENYLMVAYVDMPKTDDKEKYFVVSIEVFYVADNAFDEVQSVELVFPFNGDTNGDSEIDWNIRLSITESNNTQYVVVSSKQSKMAACLTAVPNTQLRSRNKVFYNAAFVSLVRCPIGISVSTLMGPDEFSGRNEKIPYLEISCVQVSESFQVAIVQYLLAVVSLTPEYRAPVNVPASVPLSLGVPTTAMVPLSLSALIGSSSLKQENPSTSSPPFISPPTSLTVEIAQTPQGLDLAPNIDSASTLELLKTLRRPPTSITHTISETLTTPVVAENSLPAPVPAAASPAPTPAPMNVSSKGTATLMGILAKSHATSPASEPIAPASPPATSPSPSAPAPAPAQASPAPYSDVFQRLMDRSQKVAANTAATAQADAVAPVPPVAVAPVVSASANGLPAFLLPTTTMSVMDHLRNPNAPAAASQIPVPALVPKAAPQEALPPLKAPGSDAVETGEDTNVSADNNDAIATGIAITPALSDAAGKGSNSSAVAAATKKPKKATADAPAAGASATAASPSTALAMSEIKRHIDNVVAHEVVEKVTSKPVMEKMAMSLMPELKKTLGPMVQDVIKKAVVATAEKALLQTFSSAFEAAVIPAFQEGVADIFKQINDGVGASLTQMHTAMKDSNASSLRLQQAVTSQDRELRGEIALLRTMVAQLQTQVTSLESQLTAARTEISTMESTMQSVVLHATTPRADLRPSAQDLLAQGRISDAVEAVLDSADIQPMVDVLSQLTSVQLVSKCARSLQLCIVHRLSEDMSKRDPVEGWSKRMEWLKTFVMSSVNPIAASPSGSGAGGDVTHEQLQRTFQDVYQYLQQTLLRMVNDLQAANKGNDVALNDALMAFSVSSLVSEIQLLCSLIQSRYMQGK